MSDHTPKMMSKGLMGMKFMQRAAAKSHPSSPSTPNGPPTKKSRLSNGTSAATTSDYEIIQAAQVAEEEKRQAALDKAAQHVGETKWVLSFKDPLEGKRQDSMNVRQAGFAELDADDDSEEEETRPIKMQFGGGVKKKAEPVPFIKDEDSESESDSSSDDDDPDDPAAELIRQTKREMATEKRESRKARSSMGNDSQKGTPKRQDRDRNLNGLTAISGSGRSGGLSGSNRGYSGNLDNVECFKCHQKGHMSANCPKNGAPRGSAGRGRSRGGRR